MQVAVLAGGRSPEHDVSLSSARQVLQHLDRSRWNVWPVFLDRNGAFWPSREPLPAGQVWQPGDARTAHGPLRPGTALDFLLDGAGVKVVLPVLHGPFGEDGTLQGMLELYDLPCVGSGCAASAVAMDKIRTREALAAARVPLARAYVPDTPLLLADARDEIEAVAKVVGLPCFVKVDSSGSTVGVERIHGLDDLDSFFNRFRGRFRRWFAEQLLQGEEITVGVLGNTGGDLQALPPVGIYPKHADHFTHDARYTPGATAEEIPPRGLRHDPAYVERVQQIALDCHRALVCDGMSRTDMILTGEGPKVLEVNTIPGMTGTSLLPQAAAHAGLPFPALLDRLLELALERAGTASVG